MIGYYNNRTMEPHTFVDCNGHVFDHLKRQGITIAAWSNLTYAAVRVQEDLRVPAATPWLPDHLDALWRWLDADTCTPAVEAAFGLDLTGVPSEAVRLIAYNALTTLMPGKQGHITHRDTSSQSAEVLLHLGLVALQAGKRADALMLLSEAVKRVIFE